MNRGTRSVAPELYDPEDLAAARTRIAGASPKEPTERPT